MTIAVIDHLANTSRKSAIGEESMTTTEMEMEMEIETRAEKQGETSRGSARKKK